MDEHERHSLQQQQDGSLRHGPHAAVPAEQRKTSVLQHFPLSTDLVADVAVGPADGSRGHDGVR